MQQPSVLYALGCFAAISTAHAVTSWGMDKAIYNAYHDDRRLSPLVCLLCGTFSGCMGGILCDWLGFLRSPSFTATATPGVFTSSAGRKTIINAFVCSVVYYLYMNPANYLPWSQGSRSIGHLIIAVIHLTHFHLDKIFPTVHVCGNLMETVLGCFLASSSIEPLSPATNTEPPIKKENEKNE